MQHTRPPAVAGYFYPASADELSRDVRRLLDSAVTGRSRRLTPKVLIAPHAGYVYSGSVAASAYACITPLAGGIERVVILGPAHRVHVQGLALPASTQFITPLGTISIDQSAVDSVATLPQVVVSEEAHAQEHSLEVHLPFIQLALGEFKLVPFVVGSATTIEVAEVLDILWGGAETLIIISSDLSHYLPYERARAIDEFTAESILRLNPQLSHEQACGATPINGLLVAARSHGLGSNLLDLRNSGDTAGDKSRVVGYASFAFHERKLK